MSKKRRTPARASKRPGQRSGRRSGSGRREWIGGQLSLPVYIAEETPFRPELALWLELPDDFVVGHELIDPRAPPVSFGTTLLRAMASPLIGPPRRPQRIRVAEARLAEELRGVVPDIEVVVAPTPELDALTTRMLASMPEGGDGPSYLEDGRIGGDTVAALFHAAAGLFRAAPWKVAADSLTLRLDIPALGVEGACISIIGALGENLGLVIFPSRLAMDRFLSRTDGGAAPAPPLDLGTTTLSLNFERAADLPARMRREAADQGWPVAGPAAYPWVQHRDRDGALRPLYERDVRIATACASSVAALFARHGELFAQASPEPIRERFADAGGLETWLALPYETAASAPAGGEPRSGPRPGATPAVAASAAELHRIDGRLVEGLLAFAARRFAGASARIEAVLAERDWAIELAVPMLVYQGLFDGKPLTHWFAQENDRRLSDTERGWLQAQQTAWLSLWEVLAVEPGRGLKLRDLLTGAVREVQEAGASKSLLARHVVLARIVDHQGLSLLCGTHNRPLPPRAAAAVAEHARRSLRRKGGDPEARLREEKMGRYLLARWEDTLAELDAHPVKPRLRNTDDEDLLLTIDRFAFDPSLRREVEAGLETIEGVRPLEGGGSEREYLCERPGATFPSAVDNTLLGSIRVGDATLRVETNSIARADRLRKRIEAALGGRIRHRLREHTDPLARIDGQGTATAARRSDSSLPADEANAVILEFKRRHYAHWPDQPLPALGGRAPRTAVRTASGRAQVDLLLKECELAEAAQPEGQRFDFAGLRRELGLLD